MSSSLERAVAPLADRPERADRLAGVFFATVVLSACSILYELLAAQTMTLLAGFTVVWYSLTVGVFLAAMGIGSLLSRNVGRESPWLGLYRVEVWLTVVGGLCVILIHLGQMASVQFMAQGQIGRMQVAFIGTAAVVVSAVGILTGIELPLLMRIGRGVRDESGVANTVLGLDYFGSLVGSLSFPLLILPHMELVTAGLLIALINLLVATTILVRRLCGLPRYPLRLAGLGLLWALLVVGLSNRAEIQQYFLKKYYYYLESTEGWSARYSPMPELPAIERHSSRYQKIDLMRDVAPDYSAYLMTAFSSKFVNDPDYPQHCLLFLNGDFQINTTFDEGYHEWFAHVPIITTGAVPRRVLLLGGGDGLLARELLKYKGIESILHVDLDPVLVDLARTHKVLKAANRDALRDPRIETRIGDGYQFVRRSKEQFDAAYIDFPTPMDYDLAKLYSREFFHFVRARLAPGGFAAFDAVGTSLVTEPNDRGERWITESNDWPIFYHTLRKAGFETVVPFLSSLEEDNEKARQLLRELILKYEGDAEGLRDASETPEQRERRIEEDVDEMMYAHVSSLEQGFIFVTREAREIVPRYRDFGVPLDLLSEKRYPLAFRVEFPKPDEIDESLVNSILRPTLPTGNWWLPRRPF